MTSEQADERIRLSVRRLHEWRWMITLSNDPEAVLAHLRAEAKFLVELGLEHPRKAADIGRVVVAYQRFIVAVKEFCDRHMRRRA